jgi:integrase
MPSSSPASTRSHSLTRVSARTQLSPSSTEQSHAAGVGTEPASTLRRFKRSVNVQRILQLCLITGQRVGEVAGLPRAELDLKGRAWNLPAARTKDKRPHTVPLSELALSVITDAIADADGSRFVFPEGEGALSPVVVARTLGRALTPNADQPHGRFRIAYFTTHDLRRTALTGITKLGVAPITIAHVANHRSVAKAGPTLGIYVQHDYGEKRTALDRWGETLAAIVQMPTEVVPLKPAKSRRV